MLLSTAASWPCKCVCRHGWRSSRNAPLESLEVRLTHRQSTDLLYLLDLLLVCLYLFVYFSVTDCLAMLFKHLAFPLTQPNLETTAYTTAVAHQTPAHTISMCWIHTAKRVGSGVGTKQMSRVYLIGICRSPKYLSTKTESSILRLVILARSRFDSVVTLQSTMLDGACTAPGWGHVEPWQLHSHLPPCLSMISSP